MERIQKILAHGGIASRRAAEQLIRAGRVRVNGRIVTELGTQADPRHDRVEVDGKRVVAEELVYVVLHKPRGVVSTMSDPEGRPTVKELLESIPGRVYPVGRLDFATSGVLLATNDGELADGLLHPRKVVPKTYVLKVKGVMKPEDLEHWRKGIKLEDGMTAPADAKLLRHEADKTWLELTIREGRNQQIRRMGEATGFIVMRLARLAFADVSAEGLAPGRWRHLTRDELMELKKTYGVPRSIPSAPEQEAGARKMQAKAVYVRGAVKGAAGRTQRNMGAEAGERPRGGARSRGGAAGENWGDARGSRGADATRDGAGVGAGAGRGRAGGVGGARGSRGGESDSGRVATGRNAGGGDDSRGSDDPHRGATGRDGGPHRGASGRDTRRGAPARDAGFSAAGRNAPGRGTRGTGDRVSRGGAPAADSTRSRDPGERTSRAGTPGADPNGSRDAGERASRGGAPEGDSRSRGAGERASRGGAPEGDSRSRGPAGGHTHGAGTPARDRERGARSGAGDQRGAPVPGRRSRGR